MPRNPQADDDPTAMPAEFVAILRCPVSGAALTLSAVATGVDPAERGWLMTTDGSAAYPVRDGIARLTPADRVALNHLTPAGAGSADASGVTPDGRKAAVKAFYDTVGWQQDAAGAFHDSGRFDDMRPVSAGYLRRCRNRLRRLLPASGRWLLDCASGPLAFDEYLAYSRGFERRICVDLSEVALRAARRRIGRHGIYVLADATRLPFAAGSMDTVLSLNTLFHIPAGEQALAMREFLRVAAPQAPVLVAYSWGDAAPLTRADRRRPHPARPAARPRPSPRCGARGGARRADALFPCPCAGLVPRTRPPRAHRQLEGIERRGAADLCARAVLRRPVAAARLRRRGAAARAVGPDRPAAAAGAAGRVTTVPARATLA